MTDVRDPDVAPRPSPWPYMTRGWPLLVSLLTVVIAEVIGGHEIGGVVAPDPQPAVLLIALSALAIGVVALARARTAAALPAVLGVAAAAAALLVVPMPGADPGDVPAAFFALAAPWRYAVTPIAVHLAFVVGWPHRQRHWFGVVMGWYLLHAAMLVAVAGGVAVGEAPLVHALDQTVRRLVLEPAGAFIAIVALGLAAASPVRRPAERRASGWCLAAVVLGLVPVLVVSLARALNSVEVEGLRGVDLSLFAFPVLATAALFSMPFTDRGDRDAQSLRLTQRVLDEPTITGALEAVAGALRTAFDADGALVRLVDPPVSASVGTLASMPSASVTADPETSDERRVLIAPLGRRGDPFGEVRLEARHYGAYGRQEREWLVAMIAPVAIALRARRRELQAEQRTSELLGYVSGRGGEVLATTHSMPSLALDDEMAVPPPVDAREVLGQLSDGITRVSRQGDGLEEQSAAAQQRVRAASDQVAGALDGLQALGARVARLTSLGHEIDASNQTVSGVAFRTNLLANNAALEATRAGAAGRTFGVLAEEIRRLADATESTSRAIAERTASLAAESEALGTACGAIVAALADAIREAEASEDAARRLAGAAAELESASRSLRPALEEAHAVAERRSARDLHLTATLDRLLVERNVVARALVTHRDALERLGEQMERIGQQGARRGGPAGPPPT